MTARGALRALPEKPRRGVLYLRQSTAKEETISDAIQRAACVDYCARNGIEIVSVIDPDYPSLRDGEVWEQHTGRVWHKRKGVQRALRMVETGEADVVVLWKWNRLSRRRLHWAVAEQRVQELGGEIHSATEPADMATASGRLSRNMLVDLAEYESDTIGEGWRAAHDNRRKRGLPPTGGRRFGYTHVKDETSERYEINEDEAEVVRFMYDAYLDGRGFPGIADELNQRGIPSPRGAGWSQAGVRVYCDSGFAAGLLNRMRYTENGTKHVPLDQRKWDKGAHASIIDGDTWQRYLRARAARHFTPAGSVEPTYALAGLVKCGDCDGRYVMTLNYGTKNGKRGHAYLVCGQWKRTRSTRYVSVRLSRVDDYVKRWLRDFADEVDDAAAAAKVERATVRAKHDVEMLAREALALEKQLGEATRKNLAGVIPDAVYVQVRDDIDGELREVKRRLHIAESAAHQMAAPPRELAVGILNDWDILPLRRKRKLLGQLIQQINIHPTGNNQATRIEIVPTWEA